jgi:hypothetical protein
MLAGKRLVGLSLALPGLIVLCSCNGDSPLNSQAMNYALKDGPKTVFAADLDGHGDNDLAVANHAISCVSVLLNNGDGTFQEAVDYCTNDSPLSVR